MPLDFIDLDRVNDQDIAAYRRASESNVQLFTQLFQIDIGRLSPDPKFAKPEGRTRTLIERISDITNLPIGVVEAINTADEIVNDRGYLSQYLGCTAIGHQSTSGDIIGQTMDLYNVSLAIIKEGDAIYITMPPYLTLTGINSKLAMCTNHLFLDVDQGVPISHIRREILYQESIYGAISYFEGLNIASGVNFLLTDGNKTVNTEVTRENVNVSEMVKSQTGKYIAHTNHLIQGNFQNDNSCGRLARAVQLLESGKTVDDVLNDPEIYMQVYDTGFGIRFGSIYTTIMDVTDGQLYHKLPGEINFTATELS